MDWSKFQQWCLNIRLRIFILCYTIERSEISKTRGTNKSKQTNQQKWKILIIKASLGTSFGPLYILWWIISSFAKLKFSQLHKMRKSSLSNMRKSEKTCFQWPKVSKFLTTSQSWFQCRSQIFVSGTSSAQFESEKKTLNPFPQFSKSIFGVQNKNLRL